MNTFTRAAFSFIVSLHPTEFRAEFGDDMAWIFDEQMASVEARTARFIRCAELLLDALRSAFVQHTLRERPLSEVIRPHFVQTESTALMIRATHAGFIFICSLFNIFCIVLALHMAISCL
jgi:hypothetical protein